MSSYTITITPDDTTRASTTLRVDVSEDAARITELLVRAGSATGLAAHQLPAVDLDLLIRAITPGGSPAALRSSTRSVAAESASAVESPAPSRRATSRRRGGKAAGKAAGKSETTKALAARTTRTAAKKTSSAGERAYRRAPGGLLPGVPELGVGAPAGGA